ncbi:MAG: hypothetical protein JWP63_6294 [Candidatus Solibacter sp.]|jgi:hypothetical protein|nr:hypothetical protein [Candidatus Solibacter sp.]
MNDVINEYQKWKQQGEDLRIQAKTAMETRFREVLNEAVQIAEMYKSDFGAALKPPPAVTSFRFKASVKPKGKKVAAKGKPAPAAAAPAKPEPTAAKVSPKVAGLQKRLATARKKLDDAKTAGTPTRVLEDKIYEIEDELRLAAQA